MKKLALFFGLLFVLCGQIFAQVVDIPGVSIEPKFIKSYQAGQTNEVSVNMSLYINRAPNAREKIYLVAILSKDEVWGNAGDLAINLNASAEPVPYENVSQNDAYQLLANRISDGTETYTFKFKIPNSSQFAHGETWNLIVKIAYDSPNNPILGMYPYNYKDKNGVNKNQGWITPVPDMFDNATLSQLNALNPPLNKPNAVSQIGVKTYKTVVEIADNKESIFNTAFIGDKSARAELVIVKSAPKLDVKATPPGNTGGEYTFYSRNDIETIFLKALDPQGNDYNGNVTIKYTVNGSDPSGGGEVYDPSKGVVIKDLFANGKTEVTVKAQASGAAGYDPSLVKVWTYKLELPVAGGSGDYFDTKGKGGVDKVVIKTNILVESLPDSIELTSPWDNKIKVTVYKDEMKPLENNETITIERIDGYIFEPAQPAETDFDTRVLGKLFGDEYGSKNNDLGKVTISDKIAPVPIKAVYTPGEIDVDAYKATGEIKTGDDILKITFSEKTHFIPTSGENIFEFYSGGVYYKINLIEVTENDAVTLTFKVKLVDENVPPVSGDILYLFENTVKEQKDGGVTQENKTSVELEVGKSASYLTIINTVTPVIPGKMDPFIVVDFIKKSKNQADRDNLNIGVKIIDATGNLVIELDGFNENGNISAEVNDKNLQMRIKWNGKNHADRDVGAGAYLAALLITGPDGRAEPFYKIIGVGTKK